MAAAAGLIRLDGPEVLAARLSSEMQKWQELILRANIRPE
jgi:hypothetical protein